MTTARPFDPAAFHQFEQMGWERAAEHDGDAFGALTIQTAGPMLDAADATPGARLLDVACGPGFIAAAAARRGAAVVGLEAIRAAVRRGVEAYMKDGAFLVPMPAVLASATRQT